MTDAFSQLPWEDLRRTEGDLPWSALETFADAVVSNPDLARELFAEYDRAWQAGDIPTYINLYVPAIFALAAPKLGDPQHREIGGLLVDRLMEAGKEGATLTQEALSAAAGSMGPILLPKVLDMLESVPQNEQKAGAWPQCWNLTALAIKAEDATIRDRTIQACVRLLEQIERREDDPFWGISAAWTLALLKYTEAASLLQRFGEQTDPLDGRADYKEALQVLEGRSEHVYQEAWDWPVREWLESLWRTTRQWDARGDSADSEEAQEAAARKRARELSDRFAVSRQAADLPGVPVEDTAYISRMLLEYAQVHEGTAPEELTKSTLWALLLDIFPRKISAEREFFEKVPPVVAAFLSWMASEGTLPDGASLAQIVTGWADEIVAAAMDPANWGPAKRFTMESMRAGVDVTNQKDAYQHMFEEAQRALEEVPYALPGQTPTAPPIPIVEHSSKVGRNDPCPCGSGKKYKKCCGSPAKGQAANV
jgi:hypothetical protein